MMYLCDKFCYCHPDDLRDLMYYSKINLRELKMFRAIDFFFLLSNTAK